MSLYFKFIKTGYLSPITHYTVYGQTGKLANRVTNFSRDTIHEIRDTIIFWLLASDSWLLFYSFLVKFDQELAIKRSINLSWSDKYSGFRLKASSPSLTAFS